jgi:hypothetical protein
MKKGLMLVSVFVFLLMGNVLASDVAYIYKNEKRVEQGFLDVFFDMGLEVEFIEDKNIITTDFSKYQFIFLGNEKFRYVKELPSKNIIVANGFYPKMFGFMEMGRSRKMASNHKLKIKQNGDIVEVYRKPSYSLGRSGVPYYYTPAKHENDNLEQVGLTFTKRDVELGSVISYLDDGNSKCFFGITETKFWTEEASNLFEECVKRVQVSGIHDVSIDTSYTNSVGGLRIKEVSSGDYLLDEIAELECGEKYTVSYKTWNLGDFTEDIEFSGVFGDFSWSSSKTGLSPGGSTTSGSKTITIDEEDFPVGIYDIMITATIPVDANMGDNSISRRVEVDC